MNDITPPGKNRSSVPPRPATAPLPRVQPSQQVKPQEPVKLIEPAEEVKLLPPILDDEMPVKKPKRRKRIGSIVALIIFIIIAVAGETYAWYVHEQTPVSSSTKQVRVVVASGEGPQAIGKKLLQQGLIRSTLVFDWYTRLHQTAGKLQAGTYSLSPSMSLDEIVSHLTSGKTDIFKITFLPGATLAENKAVLAAAGYSSAEIDAATKDLSQYQTTLFDGKPANSDLEGYIYGETYQFSADTSVHDILQRTFDEYEGVIEQYKFKEAFKAQGLTLYQGIILASIVQREMSSHVADMPQVAQVFYSRLAINMPLGSDVTFEYAAKKLGVAATPTLDSPYNTRIYPGLPPGPIATPGLDAMQAVAHPASGSYLYFLSGDDGKTYFAMTDAEHEQNITNHCQQKCFTN